MEVKKITEGMTAPQVAQVIDDNFKAQNAIIEEDITKQNNVIGVSEYKDFSEAEAVNVGDVRKYNGLLYECVEATTGAFDASKWKKSSFKAETEKKLTELGSKVNYWNPTRSVVPNERYTIETALAKLDEIIGVVPAGFILGFYNNNVYEEWQSKHSDNNTKENWVKVGVRQKQVDDIEDAVDELSLKSSYTAWSENSLVYSTENINTIPFCYNTYKSLLYVYAPDIYDEVYVSFFKFTKDNNGDVNLGRIRLSKTSDDTQVYINYSNTSIEKIIGGTYDGCYKCYLDGVKYIIVSGKDFNSVEVESSEHYFIVNKDIPNIYGKLNEDDEEFKRVYKRIDFEDVKKIWHEDSNVLYSLKNKQNVNITVERTVNVIKDYRFSNIKDAYIIFFQVTNIDGTPTKVRAKLVDYNGNQLFINYSNTKIELIDKGIYKGYYKCYLDNFNYIIIDGNLYSNLATYEFNDDGNKWFIVKHKSSVRVRAYNSTIGNSEDFDFVCDGYDDHEEITKAIEMIGNGGTLELSDGVFNVGPISYDGICSSLRREHCRGISIKGQGIKLTTLKMQPSGLLIDGKDLGGYYNKSSFSFIPDNQPTAFYDNVYRGLKGVVYDQDLCLSSYTLTIIGTDKDGNTITSSQTRSSASVFVRLWFNEAYKTIDSIEFTNVVFAKQPTGIFKFCLCYSNSETNIFRFYGLDNILVEDLTLDGNYENAELSFLSTDSIKNGISLSECNNVNINRVESSNFFHHGVIGVKCHTVVQTNCILNGNGHRATHYHDNSKDIIFENNKCKDNGRNHGRNQDSGTSGIFIVYSNDNCIIKNNIIEGDDYCAIDIQQERTNEDSYGQCIISGNVCKSDYDSSTGIQVYTNRNADQLEGSFKNLIISDNTISAKDSGVKITNAAIKGLVVKGNIVDMGNSGYRAFAIEGIVADAVENISITANVVANANTVSILNVKNAAVVGNVFDATNVNVSGTNIVNENNVLRS